MPEIIPVFTVCTVRSTATEISCLSSSFFFLNNLTQSSLKTLQVLLANSNEMKYINDVRYFRVRHKLLKFLKHLVI